MDRPEENMDRTARSGLRSEDAVLPLGESILASWIRSVCQTVRGCGVSPEPLMERCGMEISLLNVPDARFPATCVRRFWEGAIAATGDELLGLRCGQEMQVASLHGLGLAIVTSHSLAQVLELVARYAKVISTTMEVTLEHGPEGTTLFVSTLHGTEAKSSAVLALLAFVKRQANSLAQHPVRPLAVHVRAPRFSEESRARLSAYFDCGVDLTSEEPSFIRFAYGDVVEPYASTNAMLREANEQVVKNYLNRVRQSAFSARVEEEVRRLIGGGESVRIGDIAAKFNLSPRTLQRRLEAEGVTFAELFDKIRRQCSHDFLAHTEMSITEIAYTVGFSDPSNFSRTCCRWFGVSPAAYRRRIRQLQT